MFHETFSSSQIKKLTADSVRKSKHDVLNALNAEQSGFDHMASLLSPAAGESLESLAKKSREITLRRFGKTIQLYTPIYLSNYCMNSCLYCGFRKESGIKRKILEPDQAEREARFLIEQGFKNILLVAGDDPKIDTHYLKDVIKRLHKFIPSISLEVASRNEDDYRKLSEAGAEGVVIYQETYDRDLYKKFHIRGKKSNYDFRLNTPERVAESGFHRIGIGVLLGLGDPLYDTLALFTHAKYLLKKFWRTQVTISLPRIRKAERAINPPHPVDDRRFTQLICALRMALPDVGILLSTREEPKLRDGLMKIGITHMSAGSRTEVGGYLSPDKGNGQFHVEDSRSPWEVKEKIREIGYDPVWKDWEGVLNDSV